jgi:O-antigen/teichoic acid export membrane protein
MNPRCEPSGGRRGAGNVGLVSDPTPRPTADATAVRHVGLVGGSLVMVAIGSYAYFLLAGRVVGPATYGLVSALIGVLALVMWPCTALQWSSARVLASASHDRHDAMAAYRRALIRTCVVAVTLGLAGTVAIAMAHLFSDAVPTWALLATCLSVVPVLPFFVAIGALQGESRYAGYGVSWALTGVLRAPMMIPFLMIAAGSAAAVIMGSGVAVLVALLLAVWLTRKDLSASRAPSRAVWANFTSGLGASVVGLIGFASLVSISVVAAKLRLAPDDAGYFGAANTLGRAVLMIPQAVAIVLLPRVARRRTGDLPTGALLAIGAVATLVIGMAAATLAEFLGMPLMGLTFGSAYEPAATLLPQMLAASTLLGVLFVLVNHHAARGDHRFAWALAGVGVVHLVLLIALGMTANSIIAIDATAAILGIAVHEVIYRGSGDSLAHGLAALMRRRRGAIAGLPKAPSN